METICGTVLRIERSSIYDGDGFRTVIFLKGCPLRCQWCSTPEAQSSGIERIENDFTYGYTMTVDEVMKEIRKDSCCYFHSGGGVTLSGGEVLSQPEYTSAILQASRSECFNTAIETSFFAPFASIRTILPYVNTAFVDLKIMDSGKHLACCGVDNKMILDNLRRTNDMKEPFRLVIRIPLIPGINDDDENLERSGQFCSELSHLHSVQLLPYHRLGVDTYRKLKRSYLLSDVRTPSTEDMLRHKEILRKYVEHVL
ncbi:MAG: glycyl-radical enzyme activating protein [Clostridiales Family XIII bacterium]|jgi:pyruvate formate lyase activating enzyme|nr:glycyl-radical enzyme activating protein [Clostridiales Family XIII bacterium]